jgi:Ca-activated chloride channel family protein
MKRTLIILIMVLVTAYVHAQTAASRISQGNDYYQQSQFDLAETEYRAALEIEPQNPTAQYNLANALQKQKKFNEALTILDKLSSTAKDKQFKSSSYYNQGVAHTKLKNLEESIASYKNALRINPTDKQARENLQLALREQKKNQEQQQNQQKKSQSKMSEKEAEQKLKQLQQKEKELQQRMQSRNKQGTGNQAEDW